MKAIVMYKPRDLRFEEVDVPEPLDDEVLVKVMAVGVCGSDIPRINKFGAYILPIIPGHEFAGEIVKINGDSQAFKVGDRVTVPPLIPCFECIYCKSGEYSLCKNYSYYGSRRNGAFAQYVAVKKTNLLRIPDNVSELCAATLDPLANALHGLRVGGFKPGHKVCVYGAGPIGLYMIQAAKEMGASQIVAVDLNDKKMQIAIKCRADIAFDGRNGDVANQVIKYLGEGADLVADITGSPSAQHNCVMSAAKQGTVILLGISHQGLNLTEQAVDKIMRGQISIRGSWNSFSTPFPGWEWTHGLKLMEEGKITCEHIITHKLPLRDAPSIFDLIYKAEIFYNKIIFLPWA